MLIHRHHVIRQRSLSAIARVALVALLAGANGVLAADNEFNLIDDERLSADDYSTLGTVKWGEDGVGFGKQSSITRVFKGGSHIRLPLDLALPELALGGSSRLNVYLAATAKRVLQVRLDRGRTTGGPFDQVSIWKVLGDAKAVTLVRGFALSGGTSGVWTLEFRDGWVVVEQPDGRKLSAFIPEFSSPELFQPQAVSVVDDTGGTKLRSVRLASNEPINFVSVGRAWNQFKIAAKRKAVMQAARDQDVEKQLTTLREIIELQRHVYGPDAPQLDYEAMHLGQVMWLSGKRDDGFSQVLQARDQLAKKLGEQHPFVADAEISLSRCTLVNQDLQASERFSRAAIEKYEAAFGRHARHDAYLGTIKERADVLGLLDRHVEANELRRRAKVIEMMPVRKNEDPSAANDRLTWKYWELNDIGTAEIMARRNLEFWTRVQGKESIKAFRARASLGRMLVDGGKWAEAEEVLVTAMKDASMYFGEASLPVARLQHPLGVLYRQKGLLAAAEEVLHAALNTVKELDDVQELHAAIEGSLANVWLEQGKFDEAIESHRAVLQRSRERKEDPIKLTFASRGFAESLRKTGNIEAAEVELQNALELLIEEGRGDTHSAGLVRLDLGRLYLSVWRLSDAERVLLEGVGMDLALAAPEDDTRVAILGELAAVLHAQGKFAMAGEAYRRAIELGVKQFSADDPRLVSRRVDFLDYLTAQGLLEEADAEAKQLRTLIAASGKENSVNEARLLFNIADIEASRGRFPQAISSAKEAARILSIRSAAPSERIAGPLKVAHLQLASGDIEAAEKTQQEFDEATPGMFGTKLSALRAIVAVLREDWKQAESQLVRTLEKANGLAENSVVADFGRAFALPSQIAATTGRGLAVVQAHQGRSVEAWMTLHQTLAVGLRDQFRLDDHSNNEQAETMKELAGEAQRLTLLLQRLKASKDADRRVTLAKDQVVRERDDVRRRLLELRKTRRNPADGLTLSLEQVQAALPEDAAIVGWSELIVREAQHWESWAVVLTKTGPPRWIELPGNFAEYMRYNQLMGGEAAEAAEKWPSLDKYREALGMIRRIRWAPVEDVLHKEMPKVRRLIVLSGTSLAPVSLLCDNTFAVSSIPSADTLVKLQVRHAPATRGNDRSAAGLLAVGNPNFAPAPQNDDAQPPEPPSYGVFVRDVVPESSAEATGILPVDVILQYADTKITNSDTLLAAIANSSEETQPVTVLIWRNGEQRKLKIKPGRMGVAFEKRPAADAIRDSRQRQALLQELLSPARFHALPGTAFEINSISKACADATIDARVLQQQQASRQRLQQLASAGELKDFGHILLATHAVADTANPLLSRLILSADDGQSSTPSELTAGDILRTWKLDADLVTLSACSTARGGYSLSDGNVGFAQTLLLAGARNVMLTRWKVDDQATALLMIRFYENVLGTREGLETPLGKAEALREAQQWLRGLSRDQATGAIRLRGLEELSRGLDPIDSEDDLRDGKPFSHPRFWAAFMLVGDGN